MKEKAQKHTRWKRCASSPGATLCNPVPDLLPDVLRYRRTRDIVLAQLIHLPHTSRNINVLNLDREGGSEVDLVAGVKNEENGDSDIGSQEIGYRPVGWHKDLESVREG